MRLRAVQTLVLGVAIGLAVGICAYTFAYAQGWSYLTDNAAACANCHVMREQYDGWLKSSHRAVAVCNDCHTPAGFFGKYATKVRNGIGQQFYLDFVEAENSTGFHAAQESARILGESINFSRQGQIAVRGGKNSAQAVTKR